MAPPERLGAPSRLNWSSADEFALDGVSYVCRPRFDTFDSTPERFCIRKARPEIERLERLLAERQPESVFELGIHKGGSTALIAQLAAPATMIAIDVGPESDGAGLAGFLAARRETGTTAIHWGVDQSDGERLAAIAAEALGEGGLDLVIDDASHLAEPTRASFDALFPLLRPGGLYLIEDWSWAHAPINLWPDREPLSGLVLELAMGCGHAPEALDSLEVDGSWAVATRGPAELDPASFSLRELIGEAGRELADRLRAPAAAPARRRLPWRRPG